MKTKVFTKERLLSLPMILIGNALLALGVTLFVAPNELTMAGATGLGLLFFRMFGIPVSLFVLIFNAAMLVLSYFLLGRKFFFSTLLSSFIYPALLSLFERILTFRVTEDTLTAVIMAGALVGSGIGLVVRAGASTGGTDIPEIILHKYAGIPLPTAILIIDATILLFMLVDYTPEQVLHGVMLVGIQAYALDKTLLFGMQKMQIKAITRYPNEVAEALMRTSGHGVTFLHSRTGYEKSEGDTVLSVISARQLSQAKAAITRVDPAAFIIINSVSEVHGKGFSDPL